MWTATSDGLPYRSERPFDMTATISVIIPTYNYGRFIGRCLDSVLRQTYRDTEILVVDDGSDDGTEEVMKHYPSVLYTRLPENRGVSAARNIGLQMARGRFVAFIDADDEWHPEKLARQYDFLENHGEYRIVFCKTGNIFEDEALAAHDKARLIALGTESSNMYFPSMLARREVFDEYGPLDESLRYSEDTDWLTRIVRKRERTHCLQEVLYYRHIHRDGLTMRENPMTREQTLKFFAERIRRSRTTAKEE